MQNKTPAKVFLKSNAGLIVAILLIVNFLLRLFVFYNTKLFSFSDYTLYLNGVENIARGGKQYLLNGNFLFGISYLGYFAKYILGNLNYFFIFNCLLGTLTSLILFYIIVKVTGSLLAGMITVLVQTLYTEFMTFSSVFYSPVLMIFLLSLFILLTWFYITTNNKYIFISSASGLILIFLLTFFFKPELKYFAWFLLIPVLFFIRKNKSFSKRLLTLSFLLLTTYFLLTLSSLITHPKENVISNGFVFFGHTDYGGDGGEGSFVYPENKTRYQTALAEYCKTNNIVNPNSTDMNSFQRKEMFNFITNHPFKWVKLQFTKFFRTFGVIPETSSFKILYTGLFKGNLWLTSIIVVAPVAIIIILFILFFNYEAVRKLIRRQALSSVALSPNSQVSGMKRRRRTSGFALHSRQAEEGDGLQATGNQPCELAQNKHLSIISQGKQPATSNQEHFLSIYLLLFVYYLIATIFYGQYQERYRMPLMVVFIIPVLGYFIASFNKEQFLKKTSLMIKSAIIVLFLTIWTFQAEKAISNKERLNNALESVKDVKSDA
jgi:hypothetical protein